MSHATNKHLTNRLKRANGHLAKIIAMIEENQSALDVAQQLQAVVSALEKAKTVLVTDHIEHHLEDTLGSLPPEAQRMLTQLSELSKYL